MNNSLLALLLLLNGNNFTNCNCGCNQCQDNNSCGGGCNNNDFAKGIIVGSILNNVNNNCSCGGGCNNT